MGGHHVNWHEKLVDVRETRSVAVPLTMRDDDDNDDDAAVIEGYASTFADYEVYGGPTGGGWIERLDRGAFNKTLMSRPDCQLLVNHEGWPLARTKSGTLELSVDHHGLKVRARLDRSDPDVQRLLPKLARRDFDEMSFAFRVLAQTWNDDYTERTIREVNLQKGDVSIVNYGMNPNTSVALAETIGALRSLSGEELAEIRSRLGLPAEPTRTGTALPEPAGPTNVASALREHNHHAYAIARSDLATKPLEFGPSATTTRPRDIPDLPEGTTPMLTTTVPADPTADRHLVYRRNSGRYPEAERTSWISDWLKTELRLDGDGKCRARLAKHADQVKTDPAFREWRDISRVSSEGGYGAPPKYLVDDYVLLARPGRAFADSCHNEALPSGCSSLNLPKMASGTAEAIQTADNTEIVDVDLTDELITADVETVAGQIGVSIQLLQQSPADISAILFRDLMAAHATQTDLQVIAGTGSNGEVLGVDNTPGIQSVAVASSDIPGFYKALGNAIQIVNNTRFMPPEVVIMHPVRFSWICSLIDNQNRPLTLPYAGAPANGAGVLQKVASERVVGQIMGLPIVIDSSVTVVDGSDVVYVARASDLILWESPFKLRVLPQVKGPNLTVTIQAFNYLAFTASRYTSSVVRITGLTSPEF